MKKTTLRLVILTEAKANLEYDLKLLQDATYVTTLPYDKSLLHQKINYTKSLIEEVDKMIVEL